MKLAPEVIKTLKENPSFNAFQEYFLDKARELDTTIGLDELSNDLAGEEAKVRLKTSQFIRELFAPIVKYEEPQKPTEEDIKQREKELGL